MKYPNAAKGVKQIYYSVILSIILLVVTLVVTLLAIAAGDEGALVALVAVLAIVLLILGIACLVYEIMGAWNASKDNETFKNAFYCLIGAIVASLVGGFAGGVFGAIMSLIDGVLELVAIYLIFTGLIEFSKDLKIDDMAEKGTKYRLIYLVANIVAIVVGFVGNVLPEELSVIGYVISIVSAIISIVAFILYFLYLKGAVVMLENAKAEEPKDEWPKAEQPMAEEPKAEEPKEEAPAEEEPKDESNPE